MRPVGGSFRSSVGFEFSKKLAAGERGDQGTQDKPALVSILVSP